MTDEAIQTLKETDKGILSEFLKLDKVSQDADANLQDKEKMFLSFCREV